MSCEGLVVLLLDPATQFGAGQLEDGLSTQHAFHASALDSCNVLSHGFLAHHCGIHLENDEVGEAEENVQRQRDDALRSTLSSGMLTREWLAQGTTSPPSMSSCSSERRGAVVMLLCTEHGQLLPDV
jgi:hypothetical protein